MPEKVQVNYTEPNGQTNEVLFVNICQPFVIRLFKGYSLARQMVAIRVFLSANYNKFYLYSFTFLNRFFYNNLYMN